MQITKRKVVQLLVGASSVSVTGCGSNPDGGDPPSDRICWLTVVNNSLDERTVTVRITDGETVRVDREIVLQPDGTENDGANIVPKEVQRVEGKDVGITVASGGATDSLELSSIDADLFDLFASVGARGVQLYYTRGCPTDTPT